MYDEPCRRVQLHFGIHVGDRRVWTDEHSGEDLIERINLLTQALDDADKTISDMEMATDDLVRMVSEQSQKIAKLSEGKINEYGR